MLGRIRISVTVNFVSFVASFDNWDRECLDFLLRDAFR
jgi:hypothetical protein